MSSHRYGGRPIAADYARAAAGLGCCLTPLVLAQPAPLLAQVLAGTAGLFALFAFRTAWRHRTRIELEPGAIRSIGPKSRCIQWREVRAVNLRYYSTRRDRSAGWMQLTIGGAGQRISADSTIGDFAHLVDASLRAARANGVGLNEHTRANAQALGLGAAE